MTGCRAKDGHIKKRWATRRAAEFVAKICDRTHGYEHAVYHCPDCEGWHTSTVRHRGRVVRPTTPVDSCSPPGNVAVGNEVEGDAQDANNG